MAIRRNRREQRQSVGGMLVSQFSASYNSLPPLFFIRSSYMRISSLIVLVLNRSNCLSESFFCVIDVFDGVDK